MKIGRTAGRIPSNCGWSPALPPPAVASCAACRRRGRACGRRARLRPAAQPGPGQHLRLLAKHLQDGPVCAASRVEKGQECKRPEHGQVARFALGAANAGQLDRASRQHTSVNA